MTIRIYSTDTDAGCLSVIDRTGKDEYKTVCRIPVGNAPRGSVRFTRGGRGFVSNCGGDTISEIDIRTNEETDRIKVGAAPRGIGIVPGDRYALVSNSGSNYISIVDLGTRREVSRVAVGRDPRHMAVTSDGKAAYVAVWGSHYVAKLDISHLRKNDVSSVREVTRISVGQGAHPYSVNIQPNSRYLYVANTQAPFASVIDMDKGEVATRIDVGSKGGRAIAFSPSGDMAFLTLEDPSEIAVIDTHRRKVIKRLDVGPGPRGLGLDPKGNTLYASSFARSQAKTITVGNRRLTFSPNTLTVIDLKGINTKQGPQYRELSVGAGPCSVSMVDLESLSGPTGKQTRASKRAH